MSEFSKFFDKYSRVARLYPALIAFAPVIWSAVFIGPSISPSVLTDGFGLLIIGSILYLLTSIARARGKVIEQKLLSKWGGWPTTIMLRHRDKVIDSITKARYHAKLSELFGGTKLPTATEEQQAPEDADLLYRSATKRLIEARRSTQYQMLHDENASYGFRRNLLGLKPIAITVVAIAAAVTSFLMWVAMPILFTWPAFTAALGSHPILPLLLALDVGYFLLFALIIRPAFVFQAAQEYAQALFRTLDSPTPSQS